MVPSLARFWPIFRQRLAQRLAISAGWSATTRARSPATSAVRPPRRRASPARSVPARTRRTSAGWLVLAASARVMAPLPQLPASPRSTPVQSQRPRCSAPALAAPMLAGWSVTMMPAARSPAVVTASEAVTGGISQVGGYVGYNAGLITGLAGSNTVNLASAASAVGGLVGFNNTGGMISASSFAGSVSVGTTAFEVGGLLGINNGGNVYGDSFSGLVSVGNGAQQIGGLVGRAGIVATSPAARRRHRTGRKSDSICRRAGGLCQHRRFDRHQ